MVTSTPSARRSSEAGYNMVILMVAVTILTIFTAAALPLWSHAMQREKEEELIFRGWQYAEAIRLFQQRQGRYPTQLKELIEVHPRSIRKLWTDPMTENGEWGLIFQGVGATGLPGQADPSGNGGVGNGGNRGRRLPGPRAPRGGEQVTVGPIVGVHSRSSDESIKTLFGEDSYDKWLFTVERLVGDGRNIAVGGGVGAPPNARGGQNAQGAASAIGPPPAKWIGRPFRPGLQVPQGGGLPGGGTPQGADRNGRPTPGNAPGVPGRGGSGNPSDQ